MKHRGFVSRLSSFLLIIVMFFTAACSNAQRILPTSTSAAIPTPTSIPATPTQEISGLTPEAAATLLSVEQVDDYPFYVMHYYGNYDYSPFAAKITLPSGFGCSLFAALAVNGEKLYGRNFDWEYSPSVLVYTHPTDGYASVGMVNLFFMRIDEKAAGVLDRIPVAARTGLLTAPSLTMDGMNEYGLTIGMALVTDGAIDDPTYDPARPTIGPLGVIRHMLDHARNVNEAVDIFKQYNIDFNGAIPIHYLLADPSGKAVLLEFHDQELFELGNPNPWHMATNHLRCIATGDGGCWRYNTLLMRMIKTRGQFDPTSAMQLLEDIKVSGTEWSVVYEMDTGDVNVVIGQEYDVVHLFHLDLVME